MYDTLGNLIEYKYNGFTLDESKECGVIPGVIGTCRWEYTYDGRGNLVSNDKYTRTTSGMAWQNEETYVYDETNHMVDGKNEKGEHSLYTYNGLGLRVGRELIMQDNTHGYTDFHDETPSVETGLNKPEVAVESYVIDYTSPTFRTLTMEEEGGFDYRWVYGLDKLSVKITSEGTNWWGQNVKQDILKDYLHQDRLGNTTNLSDKFGRVVGRADYNEWGEITYKDALDITSAYRRIYPQLNYTGHDWDDVLEMYYAKARFYDPDAKRFVEIDPVKGQVTDPLSLVSYLYCVDNPLRWVDPLGLFGITSTDSRETYLRYIENEKTVTAPTPIHKVTIDHREGYASLRELMTAYGFQEITDVKRPNKIGNKYYNTYIFSKDDKRIYVQMDTTSGDNHKTSKVWFHDNFYALAPDTIAKVDIRHDTEYATLTSHHILNINGTNYMEIDYFQELMCKMGYPVDPRQNMMENLTRNYSSKKMYTLTTLGEVLLSMDFEPAFVAGVLGNIEAEGEIGHFENSRYKPGKEPIYLKYMDSNYDYRNRYSNRNITGFDLSEIHALLKQLEEKKWLEGKFGLGAVQWTGERTMTLMKKYIEVSNGANRITSEQATIAEGLMLSEELGAGGSYNWVYRKWGDENPVKDSPSAANNAGYLVAKLYEVSGGGEVEYRRRGGIAEAIYKAMMGS